MADRILPHSIEAENALLGCLIVEPELMFEVIDGFSAEDFYNTANRTVYQAIEGLYEEGSGIDQTTITAKLESTNTLERAGGMDHLIQLVASAPLEHNVKEYSSIVRDHSLTRALIHFAQETIESAYSEHENVDELIADAETKLFRISQNQEEERNLVPIKEIVFNTLARIHEINQNQGKLTGLSTGFSELDRKTSGLQDSDLIIIAARPSMGKTALALNIANHVAIYEDKSILIFSLEMSREQLVQRMILSEALVDSNRVRTGDLNGAEDWNPITISAEALAGTRIMINDTPGLSLAEMRSILRRIRLERAIDLIIIDYMQLMSGSRRSENRQNEISEISRGLKAVAREMQCPVICLSQLARGPEARNDKRPMLSDLRDSGSIEQDADVVMFLYRDAYYNKEEAANPFEAELIIAKQRNGPTGKIFLRWLPEFTKFTDPVELSLEEEYPS